MKAYFYIEHILGPRIKRIVYFYDSDNCGHIYKSYWEPDNISKIKEVHSLNWFLNNLGWKIIPLGYNEEFIKILYE